MLQDMRFSEIGTLIFMPQVFSPASVIFAGVGVLLSVCILNNFAWAIVTHPSNGIYQAAKNLRGSHDTLVDIFKRMEMFFRRLEIYTELQPTAEMMNIIIQIMTEVISILGIATKEIKQGRISNYSLYKICCSCLNDV
jgi:hypothetical protein